MLRSYEGKRKPLIVWLALTVRADHSGGDKQHFSTAAGINGLTNSVRGT